MKVTFYLSILAATALSFNATAASRVVDTTYVEEAALRGAIIWDIRGEADYKKEHIPGAINIGDAGKMLRNENTEDYLPLDQVEKILGAGGIDPEQEIVVYGAKGNPYVYFAEVTMEYLGAKNAHAYHGGIDDWKAAGKAVNNLPVQRAPLDLHLKPANDVIVTTAEVRNALNSPEIQIVDARTPKEYKGEDIRAIRGGHIPNAVNIPFEQNWIDPDTMKKLAEKKVTTMDGLALKSPSDLNALYAKLNPNKETIVYCQSSVRASESATVLKDLGFHNVKVYDSSWLGYGNTLDAPAEDVTFFNVGLMTMKMGALQKRVEVLEKELAEIRKPSGQ
ncbi:Thiosulfate sulfurtransferase [Gammaproteobacteria bacterium]